MVSIPAPVPLSRPVTWWQNPKIRGRIIAIAALACAYGFGLAYGSWTRVCAGEHCPSISRLVANPNHQVQTSKVFAADGRTDIPIAVRQAFIATEDKRFYDHHGIDYWRILGAIKNDLVTMSFAQGFSTITMQLARNIFPEEISREKTLTRKLKEARVAVEIEHNFPKDTILQLYLNQINLGAGAHGVEAAAQIYFGKHARQLNVAEAATLAALPKLPAFYNPRTHPERAVRRRNVVLGLMRDQGFLSPEEAELWSSYPLVLTSTRTNYGDVAPYFVEWLRVQLDARFGRDLYEGGLRIYTRHAGSRRARVTVPARRHRGRRVFERQVPRPHDVSRVPRVVQGLGRGPRAVHAVSPGRARGPRGEHGLHPRHDRRARLR
ncbi:MAG: hypothetical protein DMD67_00695 [Gemmatimonadetes bacterium]|nr:MAG: hypothetical protein DMD67_00695 [Gemmatimonadota bacterium]